MSKFTLEQLKKAWDKALAGTSIKSVGISRDSYSFNALEKELLKTVKKAKKKSTQTR